MIHAMRPFQSFNPAQAIAGTPKVQTNRAPMPRYKQARPAAVAQASDARKPSGCWGATRDSKIFDTRAAVAQHGHMLHVLGSVDPKHYEDRKFDTDPRDIAYAYLLIGERMWLNVLFPVANQAELADVLVEDIDQFSARFKALPPAQKSKFINGTCKEDEFEFAIEMYKNRLAVAHPNRSQAAKSATNLEMHFAYLYLYESGSGFQFSQHAMKKMADELEVYSASENYRVKKDSIEPLQGARDPALASNAVVNTTLALLYIQDYAGVNGFWAMRNAVAHNQGSDAMYQAYVNKVFPNHPHQAFMSRLKRYTKNVRRYRDEARVDVEENLQTEADEEESEEDAVEAPVESTA
jgi:hypothetical protein